MKPILFNTEMVRAIIAGRKTQTRLLLKPQPVLAAMASHTQKNFEVVSSILGIGAQNDTAFQWHINGCAHIDFPKGHTAFAKHQRGDISYVRETFRTADGGGYWYKAEMPEPAKNTFMWTPRTRMPKEAARLFLRITDVRVERLQDIGEEDAIAEGVEKWPDGHDWKAYGKVPGRCSTAKGSFRTLWNSIYGTPAPVKGKGNEVVGYVVYPWNDEEAKQFGTTYCDKPLTVVINPWVWAYTFERIEKP